MITEMKIIDSIIATRKTWNYSRVFTHSQYRHGEEELLHQLSWFSY